MIPTDFPEANTVIKGPEGNHPSQVKAIPAFIGQIHSGGLDGATVGVIAWRPTADEIAELKEGAPIYVTCIGGVPPHRLSTKMPRGIKG